MWNLGMRINDQADRDIVNMLVLKIVRHDKQALRDLHSKMGDTLYSILLTLLGDPDLSKMTYMELLPKIWRDASKFRPSLQDGTSWLIAETRRLGIERQRQLNPNRRLIADGVEIDDSDNIDQERFKQAKKTAISLNKCIRHLPPLASDLIVASYIYGLTRLELAKIYEQTENSVSQTLKKASQFLKICLRET